MSTFTNSLILDLARMAADKRPRLKHFKTPSCHSPNHSLPSFTCTYPPFLFNHGTNLTHPTKPSMSTHHSPLLPSIPFFFFFFFNDETSSTLTNPTNPSRLAFGPKLPSIWSTVEACFSDRLRRMD